MMLALLGLAIDRMAMAETEGYKTIEWNDLMPDPWVKEMTKEMAALSKMSYLQDTSDEANKAMNAMRKKLDDAPIVKTQLNKKFAFQAMLFRWMQKDPKNVNFYWFLISALAYIRRLHRRTKLCWCGLLHKAKSKKCPSRWMSCGWKVS